MIGAAQIASLAEGVAIAERAGLDLAVVAEAIATGQAASAQVVRNDHERNVVFTPALRLKDVEYALQFARTLGIGGPFGELAASQLRQLCDLGHTRASESKIIEVARLKTLCVRSGRSAALRHCDVDASLPENDQRRLTSKHV